MMRHFYLTTIDKQCRTFSNTRINIPANFFIMLFGNQWSHVGSGIHAGADFHFINLFSQFFYDYISGLIANGYGNGDRHAAFTGRTISSTH